MHDKHEFSFEDWADNRLAPNIDRHPLLWVAMLILAFALVLGLISYFKDRDRKIAADAAAYEQCIQTGYGMTPGQYLSTHNQLPPCEMQVDGNMYRKVPGGWQLEQ